MKITYILIPLLLLLALVIFTTIIVGETQQLAYKPGDYFVYKVKMTTISANLTCTIEASIRIEIAEINLPRVYYNGVIKDVKTSGECPPGSIPSPGNFTGSARIDVKPEEASDIFLIDPSYSGEYKNSTESALGTTTISFKYSRGVLISGSIDMDMGVMGKSSIKIDLVESSVQGLIPRFYGVYLVIVIIGLILATLIVALVYIYRRITRPSPTSRPPLTLH